MPTREFSLAELSSDVAFKRFVSEIGGNPNGIVACLKGYGSGMEASQKEYIEQSLKELAAVDVLVFDGDWLKEGSFTSVVPAFLAAKPNRRGIAFRKPTRPAINSSRRGRCRDAKGKIGLIQVPPEALKNAEEEIDALGVLGPKDLENTALGWLTINFTEVRERAVDWRRRDHAQRGEGVRSAAQDGPECPDAAVDDPRCWPDDQGRPAACDGACGDGG